MADGPAVIGSPISRPVCLLLRNLPNGGVERVTLNLATGLIAQGRKVDLVLFERSGDLIDSIPQNIEVFELGGPSNFGRAPFSAPLRLFRAFGQYCDERRPLAVIASKEQANLIALAVRTFHKAGAPTILTRHVPLDPLVVGRESRTVVRAFYRTIYRRSDAVIAVSQGIAEEIAGRMGSRYAANRLHTIANPVLGKQIDELAEAPCCIPAITEAKEGEAIILAVGRLDRQKGFDVLIEAFAQVAKAVSARLIILGEGPERLRLTRQIAEHKLEGRAFLAGWVNNPYSALSKADLFVLSSLWEGMPTVLLEALYMGVPVVSTNCRTGPSEILDGGRHGALVPTDDSSALAEAIVRHFRRGDVRKVLPAALERYSTHHAGRAYSELIENLVTDGR